MISVPRPAILVEIVSAPKRPATSRPFLAPETVPLTRLLASERLHFGKFYRPLSDAPTTRRLFDRLVNIPTHPDVARLPDAELADDFKRHCLSAR